MSKTKKVYLPLFWGILGMLFAQMLILFFAGLKVNFPAYTIIYPVVFFLLSFFLNSANPYNWILNSLMICVFPVIYWLIILWNENQLQFNSISLSADSGIIIVLLIMAAASLCAGIINIRIHRKKIYRLRNY